MTVPILDKSKDKLRPQYSRLSMSMWCECIACLLPCPIESRVINSSSKCTNDNINMCVERLITKTYESKLIT